MISTRVFLDFSTYNSLLMATKLHVSSLGINRLGNVASLIHRFKVKSYLK